MPNIKNHKYKDREGGSKSVYTYHEIDDRDECNLFMTLTALLVGFFAGIVIQMCPVYLPSVLNDSYAFRISTFYKLVFTLIAVALTLNACVSIFKKGITRIWSGHGVISGMIGAFVLGSGMAMAQSDPMLLFVQLGTLTKSSVFTFVGCLVGALTWGFFYDVIPKEKFRLRPQYFDGICKGKLPFFVVALPMALVFGAIVFVMEKVGTSYKKEGPMMFQSSAMFSPYFVATVLAVLQLPLTLFFCKSFQGFCSHIASIAFPVTQAGRSCKKKLPAFIRYTGSLSSSWAILMGVGLFFGSMTAGVLGMKNAYYVEEGSKALFSLLGGFFMITGAIYAGGDAFALAGGVANLHVPSFLNLGVMTAGAFATTKILEHSGQF